jgi:hypothetical protein
MDLIVKLVPPLRSQFEMARIDNVYRERLFDLYERNLTPLMAEYNAHCIARDAGREPVISRWKTFNTIAMIEATIDLLPHERKQMIAEISFK